MRQFARTRPRFWRYPARSRLFWCCRYCGLADVSRNFVARSPLSCAGRSRRPTHAANDLVPRFRAFAGDRLRGPARRPVGLPPKSCLLRSSRLLGASLAAGEFVLQGSCPCRGGRWRWSAPVSGDFVSRYCLIQGGRLRRPARIPGVSVARRRQSWGGRSRTPVSISGDFC